MTIERKTKYVASDGTEHNSPQAAATYELAADILQIGGTFTPMHENMAEKLALRPEALRDALNTYFEALEAHPDLDQRTCDGGPGNDYQTDPAILRKMMEHGIISEATDEEVHCGTSCDKPISPYGIATRTEASADGTSGSIPMGDPGDPSTWRDQGGQAGCYQPPTRTPYSYGGWRLSLMHWSDGNMAALRQHEREQDRLAELDRMQEEAEQELADDLFDAYMTNNGAVIDEVNDALTDTDTTDNLINKLREAGTVECQRPVMGRGGEMWDAYRKLIDAVCLEIAQRCKTMDELEQFRLDFNL